ncbi:MULTISPECIES: hypothetical protein [Cyanophyceae]|uniref:hypothetical protein n=1 Tax=Cyanophyceae TaxID=3028117 RepID=UPI00081051B9|nr:MULTISPECIES: hypothetical protein [Cyanophyceae]ANV87371.1 hypothetical protein AWQ22_07825 [Picosynechococcus sp. PCC 7117]
MVSFLALLPRALTTFLYAVAALLRFYADTDTTPIQLFPLTILQWSFLAFALGTAALLANLGLEWHAGNRSRYREAEERERETRRDALADEERRKADRERDQAAQERERAARRARIQNRGFILQTRYQLTPGRETGAALADFLSFLQEYGE